MEPVGSYFEILNKELNFAYTGNPMLLPTHPLTVKIYNSKMQHCFSIVQLSISVKDSPPSSVLQRIKIVKPGEQYKGIQGYKTA